MARITGWKIFHDDESVYMRFYQRTKWLLPL